MAMAIPAGLEPATLCLEEKFCLFRPDLPDSALGYATPAEFATRITAIGPAAWKLRVGDDGSPRAKWPISNRDSSRHWMKVWWQVNRNHTHLFSLYRRTR